MKKLLLLILVSSVLFALQTSDKLFECTKIFEQRKGELLVELERIDEQKQALGALKTATEELLKQKEVKLKQKENELNSQMAEISKKEKSVIAMLEENKKILKAIKDTKMSKISQTFSKMKAGAAANILSDMKLEEAVNILQPLQAKVIGKILTKMDPKKASLLTQMLSN